MAIAPESKPLVLRTLLGSYPSTVPLKSGAIRSALVNLEFDPLKSAYEGFRPLVREHRYDFAELAIVTYLQAKLHGLPYVLMPIVVVGRTQHQCLIYNASRGALRAQELEGRRVGVRSYTQTTALWVRGILAEEYGVDIAKVRWITFEEPNLPDFSDPPFCTPAPVGKSMTEMLLDGDIDAAVFGNDIPDDPRLRPLVADPDAAASAWRTRHGTVQINHLAVVRDSLCRTRPDIVRELFSLLVAGKAATGVISQTDLIGLDSVRRPLELAIDLAYDQQIIATRPSVDSLFDETTATLGAIGAR